MRAVKVKELRAGLKSLYGPKISPKLWRETKKDYVLHGFRKSQQPKLTVSNRQKRLSGLPADI